MLHLNHLAVLLILLLSLARADEPVFSPEDADRYDNASFGRIPAEHFQSADLSANRLLRRVWDEDRCQSEKYFFIATRGSRLPHTGPVIIDNDGHQVWVSEGFMASYNFKSQWYRGEQYLTWWSGNDRLGGHGEGYYYMYDKHYTEYKRVSPYGNFSADLHEFKITDTNTALITMYERIPWDLSAYGADNTSHIWDCLFQEIDLETNELIFQWRATDHFTFDDCYNPRRESRGNPAIAGWDWFHLNSVDKDPKGNYLISARYSHALTYIDHNTGEIIWHLGGRNNSFTDLSDGQATNIAWQHHASWQDNYQAITVYDNHAVNWQRLNSSRALKLRVDQEAMTVEIMAEARHPQEYIVHSQGSVQQMENGNLFVGYGYAAAMTEYSPDGSEVICDWQYGPLHYRKSGAYSPGFIQSYRAFKLDWKGYPVLPPKVAFNDSKLYISWNGATEHRRWTLESSAAGSKKWNFVGETRREGFESAIDFDQNNDQLLKLTALDAKGDLLGVWTVDPFGTVTPLEYVQSRYHRLQGHGHTLLTLGLILGIAGTAFSLLRRKNNNILLPRFSRLSPKWPSRATWGRLWDRTPTGENEGWRGQQNDGVETVALMHATGNGEKDIRRGDGDV